MKNLKTILLTLCVAMLPLVSCSEDDEPQSIPTDTLYDFATLDRMDSGTAVFTVQKSQESQPVTYIAHGVKLDSEKVSVGDRLIICYIPADGALAYTDCEIKLYGYIVMNNTNQQLLAGTPAEYDDWDSTIIRSVAMWETGSYLNMQIEAAMLVALKPKKFILVADASTINDPYPVLHLIVEVPRENFGGNLVLLYGSFDISAIWNHNACKGVKVAFPGVDGDETVTIEKVN